MNRVTKGATCAVVSARRRLVRGAFAAPTALTLYSGNVFAASSNLRALANLLDAGGEFPTPDASDPADTWIRVEVFQVGDVKVVKREEVLSQPSCGVSQGFVFRDGWARLDGLPEEIPTGVPSTTNKFAALLFDASGAVVGVSTGASVPGLTALTRSAGASIGLAGDCLA
jgi:hypothetical protein